MHFLKAAIDPSIDPYDAGYWGLCARETLSGARFFGSGNAPTEVYQHLSMQNAVFYKHLLLACLIAHHGWAVFLLIAALMSFFIVNSFRLCLKQRSGFGFLLSVALAMALSLQAVEYVVFNLGFSLSYPISFPLISYGNGEMVINLVLIGFMLSAFRTGNAIPE